MTRRVTFRVAASKVFGRKGAQAGSNHCLVGSKGFALGGSRAEPWPCFLPSFSRAGNGHEVSTLQTEKALDQRLGDEIPAAAPAEMAEPIDDMREAEIMAVIEQAKATINSQRPHANPAAAPHPATNDPRDPAWDPHLWASAMINSLQQPAAPVQPSP
jgi:hypothetical protein